MILIYLIEFSNQFFIILIHPSLEISHFEPHFHRELKREALLKPFQIVL